MVERRPWFRRLRRVIGTTIRALVPEVTRNRLRAAWHRFKFRGPAHLCPICDSKLKLFPNTMCPVCGSKQGHRLVWLLRLRDIPLAGRTVHVLHVAPEWSIRRRLKAMPNVKYVSGDIRPGHGDLCFDVQELPFPEATFDLIYCAHVLNCVPDDQRAMRELYRVLKPRGCAILEVPIKSDGTPTLEADDSDAARIKLFGDPVIRRVYGHDYLTRLSSVGFMPFWDNTLSALPAEDQLRYGLGYTQMIVCDKPVE